MTNEKSISALDAMDILVEALTEEMREWKDERILEELTNLEIILETDEGRESYFSQIFIDTSEALRDECVRRLHESVKSEK